MSSEHIEGSQEASTRPNIQKETNFELDEMLEPPMSPQAQVEILEAPYMDAPQLGPDDTLLETTREGEIIHKRTQNTALRIQIEMRQKSPVYEEIFFI